MKKSWNNIIKFVLGVLILSILVYKVGLKEIYENIIKISFWLILLILVIRLITFLIGAYNVSLLINTKKKIISFSKIFRYYCLTWSLSLFVPGKIGDFSLIYFLIKKKKIKLGKASAAFILDKIITFFIMSIFAVCGFFIFFTRMQSIKLSILLLIVFVFLLFFLFSSFLRDMIKKYVLRSYAKRFKGFSSYIFDIFKEHKKKIILNFILTIVRWVIDALVIYLLFLSLEVHVPLLTVVIIKSITSIVSMIPITLNGLGIRESTAVFLFGQIGINIIVTTSVYIMAIVIGYLIALLFIPLFLDK